MKNTEIHKATNPTGPDLLVATNRTLEHLIELQQLIHRPDNQKALADRQVRKLRAAIPADMLRSFDRAAEHGRAAVAMVTSSGACGGCHLKLPSGLASAVLGTRVGINKCPHCGCFLYSGAILSAVKVSKQAHTPDGPSKGGGGNGLGQNLSL
jgi:C4-type zinc ribbon domain